MSQKLAVIDIGTLKVKILIAETDHQGQIQPTYASNNLTYLGVRMRENNNRPKPEYVQDTIKELKRCRDILGKQRVTKLRVVSTHALREMGQAGREVAWQIKDEVGFDVEIISQQEEAEFFFQAVTQDFKTDQDLVIVDVGGGSVQLLIGGKDNLKQIHLLKTGAQYLFDVYSPRHAGHRIAPPLRR